MVLATRSLSIYSNNDRRYNDLSLKAASKVINMNSVKDNLWLETVVCSARKGVDARLERMLQV